MNCLLKSLYYIVYANDSVRHLSKPVFRDNHLDFHEQKLNFGMQ